MNSEDIVVDREHVHGGRSSGVHGHRDLSIVNAGEVARASWLVFFWLKREGVRVHTWVWAASVVVVGLHLVEVLTSLFLESVLAVEHQLEGGQWTREFFGELRSGAVVTERKEWHTRTLGDWHVAVGFGDRNRVGLEDNFGVKVLGGEVPEGRLRGGVGEAPDEFLDWVVVGEADLLDIAAGDGVGASVLDLLDEVFVALLREASAFLGVEVDVVGPDLEGLGVKEAVEVARQIDVNAHFVVLKGNQWQIQTWVAVEEEEEWKVDSLTTLGSSHLRVGRLLGFIVLQVVVQTPPLLVVLVDALATNGEFGRRDRTLSDPAGIITIRGAGVRRRGLEFDVHVADQVTVAGNSDGHAEDREKDPHPQRDDAEIEFGGKGKERKAKQRKATGSTLQRR